MSDFKLQFEASEIGRYADKYNYEPDTRAFNAGTRIANGEYTLENLEHIFKWKTKNRGISRIRRNDRFEVEDALRLAVSAKSERAAVAVLLGLHGVDIPVASAVLTTIDQSKFTIIDFRALEALDASAPRRAPTLSLYLEYLAACRALALVHKVTLRTLDRALWRWSYERSL